MAAQHDTGKTGEEKSVGVEKWCSYKMIKIR